MQSPFPMPKIKPTQTPASNAPKFSNAQLQKCAPNFSNAQLQNANLLSS